MDDAKQTAVRRWLQRASSDLKTSQTMLRVEPTTTDIVCFHSQQCVEKCLKAYLTNADRHIERTHDLARLVTLCIETDPHFGKLTETAVQLADYAVTTRYPDNWRDIPTAEAEEATRLAAEAMDFVCHKLDVAQEDLADTS